MGKKRFILLTIIYGITIGLSLYWYDYKLIIILILFGWGINIENKSNTGEIK